MALALVPAAGWRVSFQAAVGLATLLLVISLAVEAGRRWRPALNRLLWQLLPTIFRPWEGRRVLGSTWFAVGALLALVVYGRDVGGTALLFLIWGDPAAEIVGRTWGHKTEGKTLAGSLGCLFACLIAALVGMSLGGLEPWTVLAGAVTATLVERWSPPPDDNVWMPVLGGLVMAGMEMAL
jgi:dolichol kinase